MHTLDSEPNKTEVPLPLDAAAGHRSVRAGDGLLRLPGHLPDERPGAELDGHQPGPLHPGPEPHRLVGRHRRRQPGPVLRRGGLRHRAVEDPAGPRSGPAPTTAWSGYTRTAATTGTNVTSNVTGLPEWGTIRKIEPSRLRRRHRLRGGRLPPDGRPRSRSSTRRRTTAKTWTKISGDLPSGHPLDYVLSLAENPNREGMLFAGTGQRVLLLDGRRAHWTQFKDGLPAAPVSWIVVEPRYHDVVVSTYGRGLFVLRDITRLEQADQVDSGAPAYLYAPRPGFRQGAQRERGVPLLAEGRVGRPCRLRDPRRGRRRDPHARRARRRAGLNRATWDLRYERRRRSSCGRFRPTTRTSGRRRASWGGTRGRSSTGASSGRSARARSRRRAVHRAHDGGRPDLYAAVRGRQGPDDRRVAVGPGGVDRGADPHPRRA